MSTTQSQIIPSGRPRSTKATGVAGVATWIAIAVLAVLALVGANIVVLALIALTVLGGVLILFDRSLKIEPHEIHT
jgi:hypothetical protein